MSDNWLIFVPKAADWRPAGSFDHATDLIRRAYPQSEEVQAKVHDAIQFIDQGQNFEDVRCPACKASLMEEFGDVMNAAFDEGAGGFSKLDVAAPCCGAMINLNDLEFEAPAAFGSFQIDVMNPESGTVPTTLIDALEAELGTPVRIVWCHI